MKRPILPFLVLLILLLSLDGSNSNAGRVQASVDGGTNAQQGLTGGNRSIACPGRTNTATVQPEDGPITLTVSGWSSTPAEDALVQQNLSIFQAQHPNIKVEWVPIPLTGDYLSRLAAYYENGAVPDVFYMRPDLAPDYIATGKLLNLSPYMARDHIQATDYYSALITPFSCTRGQVYGIPKDWNTLGLFYNKNLFLEAGVPFPSDDWTWNDLRQAAKKLTKKGKDMLSSVYGIILPADSSRWLPFLFAEGGSVLSSDGTQAVFNQRAGVDALKFYSSFQLEDQSSALPANVVPGWGGQVLDAFGLQKTAMVFEGGWLISYLKQTYPDVQFGIAPLPKTPHGTRANLIFTNAWSAYTATKHPEAAWELIKFMTGTEVESDTLASGFALPSLKSLASDPYFERNPDVAVLFHAADYGYIDYFGSQDSTIHQRINLALNNVLSNKASIQVALDAAASEVDLALGNPP